MGEGKGRWWKEERERKEIIIERMRKNHER